MSLAFLEKNNRDQEWIIAFTLGHNSSVVLAKSTGEIITGYEEERLTKFKSDSSFPISALTKCLEKICTHIPKNSPVIINVGVSHWFNQSLPNSSWNRYYLDIKEYVTKFFDLKKMISIIKRIEFSYNHHQMHLDSIRPFLKANITDEQKERFGHKKTIAFVADGFGNCEEVMSLLEYETLDDYINNVKPTKSFKLKNLQYSLGLMYQYITSSVGMKENQDEYKFLGYESHIQTVCDNEKLLNSKIETMVSKFSKIEDPNVWQSFSDYSEDRTKISYSSIIDIDKLKEVKKFYHTFAKECISDFVKNDRLFSIENEKNQKRSIRILMGFILQQSVERIVLNIFKNYLDTHNILTVGGLFYNVKLNNRIMTNSKNLYCVMPLAGDQGCSIGVLDNILQEQYHTDLKLNRLNFGKRNDVSYTFSDYHIENITREIIEKNSLNITDQQFQDIINYSKNKISLSTDVNLISDILEKDSGIVNLVYSDLEFGPRALCFTTSLARPTVKNVEIINELNDRDTVMPMAPVMLKRNDEYFFNIDEVKRVAGSDRYMILTYIYKKELNDQYDTYGGVMHKVQDDKFNNNIRFSGRPQFLYEKSDNSIVYELLENLEFKTGIKALINTSYNVHGTPIVYDTKDAIDNFVYQVVMKFNKNIDRELYLFVGL